MLWSNGSSGWFWLQLAKTNAEASAAMERSFIVLLESGRMILSARVRKPDRVTTTGAVARVQAMTEFSVSTLMRQQGGELAKVPRQKNLSGSGSF
jgi:hypothetical protein